MKARKSPAKPVVAGLVLVLCASLQAADSEPSLLLQPNEDKTAFDFETEFMEGTIRMDGAYHGVSRLVHKRTGRQVIDPRYSALNLFKLMSVNQVMDQPRRMERTSSAGSNWVEINWGKTDGHAATVTARYEVIRPNAIELAVTVRSSGSYADYELFLSSYFDKVLRPYVYLQSRPKKKQPPELVLPTFNEVFRDTLLVFPRDSRAARICLDGRWERSERENQTVPISAVRRYAHCLAFLVDPDDKVGVLLMSPPRDCYAISTRYFPKDEANRMTSYSAFDFSLFGNDFAPGEERTVRARLAMIDLEGRFSRPLEEYEAFIKETREEKVKGTSP